MVRRLWLSYLAVIGVTVTLLALIVQFATSQTFSRYLSDEADAHSEMLPVMLAGYYSEHGTWDGVQPNIDQASVMIGANVALADAQGRIVAASRREIIGQTPGADFGSTIPVVGSGGLTIGKVYVGRSAALQRADAAFLSNVTAALFAAGLVVVLLAGGLSVWLARTTSQPLAEMSRAAARMAEGDYAVRVPLHGQGEVAELAHAFNQMAEGMGSVERLRRELVANVSHDLRTPLTVIRGYLEGLRSGQIADRRSAEMAFEAMHAEATRLLRMVDDLRQVAVLDAGGPPLERRPTAARDLVAAAVDRIAPVAALKGITVLNQAPADLPLVSVDAGRMGQVLFNLLDNAVCYTPASGAIVVEAGYMPRSGEIRSHVWLAVQDRGEGIPAEHLPHIFERFYRADYARGEGGAGLGLSIARAIVEAHGGQISAESEGVPGHGSRFTIRLFL